MGPNLNSDRPGFLAIAVFGAVLGLFVLGLLLFRSANTSLVPVVRSPYLRQDVRILELFRLSEIAEHALAEKNFTGTLEREEIALITLGQWLTLTPDDTLVPPALPRVTPVFVLTRYGEFQSRDDTESMPEESAVVMVIVTADTGQVLDIKAFAAGDDIVIVDPDIKDADAEPLRPPLTVEPGSA